MITLVHWIPWTGDPSRVSRDVGYKQNDPAVIDAQLRCMKESGIGGVIAWWQGPTHQFTNDAFMRMFYGCLKLDMLFIPALDQWIAKGTPNPTQAVIAALTPQLFQGMAPFFAQQWLLEFDLALVGVNLAQVQAAVPGLTLCSKHRDYSWPEVTNTMATLKSDNASPTMKIPAVFSRFNDGGYPQPNGVGSPATFNGQRDWNKSVWGTGPARVIEERAGKTYLDSLALVPAGAKYMGLVTWNDFDENSAMEPEFSRATGIRIG